jgi:hypothetical protein
VYSGIGAVVRKGVGKKQVVCGGEVEGHRSFFISFQSKVPPLAHSSSVGTSTKHEQGNYIVSV